MSCLQCKPGYAGIGTLCGLDTDLDGRPDTGLSCTDSSCRRVNFTPDTFDYYNISPPPHAK